MSGRSLESEVQKNNCQTSNQRPGFGKGPKFAQRKEMIRVKSGNREIQIRELDVDHLEKDVGPENEALNALMYQKPTFEGLTKVQAEILKFDVVEILKILRCKDLFLNIPNYVNDKPTHININLIKSALVVFLKGYLTCQQIRDAANAFDIKCKQLNAQSIPLHQDLVADTLRSAGLVLPQGLFSMWCKKSWSFLECARIENQNLKNRRLHLQLVTYKNSAKVALAGTTPGNSELQSQRQPLRDGYIRGKHSTNTNKGGTLAQAVPNQQSLQHVHDLFGQYYLFPCEFLSLACNARARAPTLAACINVNFHTDKEQLWNPLEQRSARSKKPIQLYKLSKAGMYEN